MECGTRKTFDVRLEKSENWDKHDYVKDFAFRQLIIFLISAFFLLINIFCIKNLLLCGLKLAQTVYISVKGSNKR